MTHTFPLKVSWGFPRQEVLVKVMLYLYFIFIICLIMLIKQTNQANQHHNRTTMVNLGEVPLLFDLTSYQ